MGNAEYMGEHKKLEYSHLNQTPQTAENEGKFYCNNCNVEFDRDDKMLFHQAECKKLAESEEILSTEVDQLSKSVSSKIMQCNKCSKPFKTEGKFKKHKKLCKASESDTPKQLTPRKREEKYRCTNCSQQFRKEEKMMIHVAKCTGEIGMIPIEVTPLNDRIEEKVDTNGENQHSEDSLDDKKNLLLEKNVAITIVNEDNVDHLRDTKIIEGKVEKEGNDDVPVNVETPVIETPKEVVTTPKKGRGRPKKIFEISKILEQVPPSPPPPSLPKRTSSTSRRTSSSSRTSSTLSAGAVIPTLYTETTTATPITGPSTTALSESLTTATPTIDAVPAQTVELVVARKSEPTPTNATSTAQPNKTADTSQEDALARASISNTRPKRSRKVIDKDL